MMHNFFECRIKYEKMMEDGACKKVPELYLINAVSFTDAEARIIENMKPFIDGNFTVEAIKKVNYTEVISCDSDSADKWFKIKEYLITVNEVSGKEKKQLIVNLVQASSVEDAKERFDNFMKGTISDYEIKSISDTEILDVFKN